MKKIFLTTTVLLIFAASIFAQNGDRRERIKSLRIAFITEKLELTPEESKSFWPVYNELTEKMKEVRNQKFKTPADSELTDVEAEKMLNKILDAEQEKIDLRRAYFKKMSAFLPAKKLLALHNAENQFKRQLLNRVGKRRKGKGKY